MTPRQQTRSEATWSRNEVRVVVLAALMLLTILIPAGEWPSPRIDGVYKGFDDQIMYSHSSTSGTVNMTPTTLKLIATGGSAPTVDLATGPLSVQDSFTVAISAADPGTRPLDVMIWAPYRDYQFVLGFGPEPGRQLTISELHQGKVLDRRVLGVYTLGEKYRVQADIDRKNSRARLSIATAGRKPFIGYALLVQGAQSQYNSHVLGPPVPVVAGRRYRLSAAIDPLSNGLSGLSIWWFDESGKRISLASSWQHREASSGWEGTQVEAVAPPGAATARIELATTPSSRALFGQVHLDDVSGPSASLVYNGSFNDGASDWRRLAGTQPLHVRDFRSQAYSSQINAGEFHGLFASTRIALALQSSSTYGLAMSEVTDHILRLQHQRWLAVKTNDAFLRVLVLGLGIFGVVALAGISGMFQAGRLARARLPRSARLNVRAIFLVGLVVLFFLVGNGLLSRIGSSNADIVGSQVWGHVAATHGLNGLYFLTNVASKEAIQWNGLPLQEAGFPYGPTMAYITWFQAHVYKWFLAAPGIPAIPGILADFAKWLNAAFAIADAFVLYLIVGQFRGRRSGLMAALLVMLNPAIWFAGSVWGSSQTVSLLFLLVAALFALRTRRSWAWAALFAAAMTRPQYLVPIGVLALFMLGRDTARQSALAISRATVGVYVLLLPFALAIAPSLPIDVIYNAFFLHLGNGNDRWTMPLSWGGMSIWPLVIASKFAVHGVDRILFPATTDFLSGISFYHAGSVLVMLAVIPLLIRAAHAARIPDARPQLVLLMATASMALFTLNTGTPTYHYILALALLVGSRASLPRWAYRTTVAALSTTTFSSMYAMGAYWLTHHPIWDVGIYSPTNPITHIFATAALSDWFVTVGCLTNLGVLGVMYYYSFRKPSRPKSVSQPSFRSGNRGKGSVIHGPGRSQSDPIRMPPVQGDA